MKNKGYVMAILVLVVLGATVVGHETTDHGTLIIDDAPVRIDSDTDFAEQGWEGSGTQADPYVIQGLRIDGGDKGYGIYIGNTTMHFVVRECIVENVSGRPHDIYHMNTGIYLYRVENGSIEENTVDGSEGYGIRIYYSGNNTFEDNTVTGNYLGVGAYEVRENTFEDNDISFNDIGLRVMTSSHNHFLHNNFMSNGNKGIELFMSSNNTFLSNKVEGNPTGFYMESSERDEIRENTIRDNDKGLDLIGSHHNMIYHNNFLNNDIQAHDDGGNHWSGGYPEGGNHWSDHQGDDLFHGQYQNISGSDGIIDSPYHGDGFSDPYPLAAPAPTPHVRIDEPVEGDIISSEEVNIGWTTMYRFTEKLNFSIRLNHGNWTDLGSNTEYHLYDLDEGETLIEVKVMDDRGNQNTDRVNVTVDSPPTLDIIKPTEGEIFDRNYIDVIWLGEDRTGIYYFEIKVEGGNWMDMDRSTEYTLEDLQDGLNTVYVRAWDNTGKSTEVRVNFMVDTTPPDLAITYPSDGELLNQKDITVSWTGTDHSSGIQGYEVRMVGEEWTDVGTDDTHNFIGLDEGDHGFEVRAWDRAGNYATTRSNFTVDTTPPSITISAPDRNEVINSDSVTISWEGYDRSGIDHYEIRINDGEFIFIATATRYTFEGLDDGEHTVEIRGTDMAGNTGTTEVTFRVSTGIGRYAQTIFLVVLGVVGAVLIYVFGFTKEEQKDR